MFKEVFFKTYWAYHGLYSVIFVHLGFLIPGFSLHYNKDTNHLVSENVTLP